MAAARRRSGHALGAAPGSWLDRAAIGFSLTGASLQLYFVGAVLLIVFVYNLRLLPVTELYTRCSTTR
ncbi:hypothetical protein [Micromonospora sp. b486]|uniref:hypothetical protein n=1 Tax=Micromonospora sp. b486 TaxID=3053986 RepID=UPI00259CE3DD|nr:hypothetical protein [Micromonospora sp. b486]MDM4778149.1 hypothetical protein [Micromonospora sp. b486]